MDSDWVSPAPFAALLPIDPDAPAGPQVVLSELAEGGLVFLCPQGQLVAPFAADRIARPVDGLPSPAQSVMDVLTGEGPGDLDLAVAVLAVPLWALPVADRPTVAALCEHP